MRSKTKVFVLFIVIILSTTAFRPVDETSAGHEAAFSWEKLIANLSDTFQVNRDKTFNWLQRKTNLAATQNDPGVDEPTHWEPNFNPPTTSLFQGGATYNYPILIPPGANGVQPNVGIGYNSSGTNRSVGKVQSNPEGWGWHLSGMIEISQEIKVCDHNSKDNPSQGCVKTYEDFYGNNNIRPTYHLSINGTGYELIHVNGRGMNGADGQYRAMGSNSLYVELCHGSDKCKTVDSGDSIVDGIVDHGCDFMKNDCPHVGGRYWLVITPDNTKYRLGYKAESEQKLKRQKFPLPDDQKEYYLDYNNPEFAVGPADNRASERKLIVPVLRWRVDLIQDKFNNQVIYSYEESDGDNTVFSELNYLKSISYTTDADHGVGYDVTIGFDYWANPDDDYNLPKGVVSYQTKELNEIEVLIDGEKLRSYDFVYVNSKYGDGYSFPDTKVAKQSDRCKLDSTQWNNGYMNGWHAKLLKSITEKDAYGNARVSGTPDVEFTYVFRQTGKVLTGTQINQVDPTQIDEKYFHWCRPYMKSAKLLYNGTTKRNLPSVSFNWSHWKDGEKYRDSYISREFIYSGLESSSSDKVDRDTPGFLNVYSHRDEPSITASKEGSDFPVLLGWSRVTKKTYDLAETTLYRTEETDFLALPTGHQEELLTGRPFEVRTFDGNGNQLSKSETIWAVLGEANEPKVMASRSTNYTDNQTNIGVVTANRYDPNEYYFQDRTFTWVNDKTKLGADLNTYKNLDNWNDSDPTVSQKQHLRITHNTAADTWLVGLPVRTINWAKADKDSALETVSNTLLRYDNHDCYKLNNQLGEVIPPTTGLLTAIDTFNVDESNRGLGNGICYDNYITTQFEYDGSNAAAWQRAKTIDPEGYETTYAWKDGIRLQSITTHDKLSDQTLTTSYAYDEDDTNVDVYTAHPWQVVEIKAPNATNPVRYTYDSFGRLEDTRSTSGKLIQRVTYRDEATPFELQVDTFPFANNLKVSSTSFYDGVGRVFATETTRNGTTSHQHTAFDVLSRPICQTTVNSGSLNTTNRCNSQTTTSTSYDDFKNIVTTTQPNGETVTQDTTGFIQTVTQNQTDSVTLTTISESDTYGRLSKVIEPTGAETTYAYNAGGFLTSVTDANTNVTTMGYDTLGRKLSMADPDMGSWTYEYDANGNLQKQSANNTDHLCFVYDGFNRLETKSECGSTSPLATYKYFETGQLERVEWQGMVGTDYEEFDYDPVNGLLISHAKKLGSAPLFVMKYADFSAADQPKKIEYPDGEIVSMTYDSYGVETLDAGADQLVTSMLHNIRGQMTAVNRGTNGSNTTYSYYGAGNLFRLEAIKHGAAQDQVPDYDYTYDYVGNIRTQTEQTTLGSQRQEFNYDTLNRLTSAKATTALGDAAAYTRSYSYDAIGNIQTMTIEGQTIAYKDSSDIDPSNPNQTLNPFEDGLNGSHPEHTLPHAVVRAGDQEFKYDQDGNMVYRKDKTGEYDQVFDIENRLISVTDKATNEETKFFYDASGQRTMTVETGENDEQIITYFPFPEYEEVHTTTQINQAPQWTQPPNQVTVVNTADSLQLEAIDPENDPLTFSATGLPPGLNIDSQSGLISGIPNQIQSYTVTATVIDGAGNSESVTFTWDVIESNDPPILEAINDQTNKVGEFVDLRLSGTDPDGDTITYRAEGLPAGLGLTQSNGQISGRPTAPGVFTVRAFANDGKVDSAPVTFTWTVTPNAVPMITNPGDMTHELNKEVTVQLIATDADGDALTYFAGNLPPGLAIDPVSGLISGIPTELGEFSVTFIVSDGFGGQDVESIKWTIIEPAPSCPVLENAGFEDGLNNWTLVNGATATVTSDAAEGSSAALINGGPNDANGGGWLGQDLDVVGDTTIEFTGSYKTGSYGFFQVGIDYYSDDAFIQSTLRNIDDSFTSFSIFNVSSVVPANANKAQVWMYASADDTLIVDDLFAQEVGCDGGPRSPRLTNPGDQSNTVNISIAPLTLAVSDPDSNQFTFSSTGLPTGLALN
ncbi:MAG: putative Ig domain-containing protein, partial [Chloroflexota bacterium]